MTKISKKIMGGGVLAAMGLSALSPVQQAGALLSVAGAAMWATPALALALGKVKGKIIKAGDPGAGIKRRYDDRGIIAPTDRDGIVRLTGLEPGEYEVNLIGDGGYILIQVGAEGRMAFAAQRETTYPDPKATDPRARRALPLVREWVEQCCDNEDKPGVTIAMDAEAKQMPDVNTSTAEQLTRGTNNGPEAADFIVAEREKGGPYKDPLNFAQRVGGSVTVDFGYSSVRIGDTTIIARGGNPKDPGFKTIAGSGVVELYGRKHNYVGHVTLLK